MKLLIITILTLTLSLKLWAKDPTSLTGNCKLETIGEVITLRVVDPNQHFGMFAEGYSSQNDRIYIHLNHSEKIGINIQSRRGSSYGVFPTSEKGVTEIVFGAVMQTDSERGEWLSCKLTIY